MAFTPTKKQKKRIEMFQHHLEIAKRAHEKHASKWKEWEKVYYGDYELPESISGMLHSDLKVPWVWQHIETITPRIMDPDPRLNFKPVEPTDEKLSAALNVLIKNQLYANNFVLAQKGMITDGLVAGISIIKVYWHQRKQRMKHRLMPSEEQLINGERGTVESTEVITENRPGLLHVDKDDFFWDPAATSDQNWRHVFHRLWLSKADLKAREKAGVYSNVDDACGAYEDHGSRSPVESDEEAAARRQGRYAVYEGWFKDGTRMVMCGNVLLADGENPYFHGQIPFVAWNSQPISKSLVGISEVDKLRDLQEHIWIKDAQRIDAVNYALNTVIIGDPTIPGIRNLKLHPGKVIHATNGQRLEQWVLNPNAAPAFQESESYIAAMQQMSGVNPLLSAGDPSQMNDVTATVGSIAQEEGNKRMAMKKLQFRLAIARMAKMMVQLSHQYLSQMELERILGEAAEDMPLITPEEIPMFLDVEPEAMSEVMGKMTERNSLIELLNITGTLHGTQMMDGTSFDIKPIVEDTIKSYDRDPERNFAMVPQQPPIDPMTGMPAVDPMTGMPVQDPMMGQNLGVPGMGQAAPPPNPMDMTNDMSGVMQQ